VDFDWSHADRRRCVGTFVLATHALSRRLF
jgi:hypothetical protein